MTTPNQSRSVDFVIPSVGQSMPHGHAVIQAGPVAKDRRHAARQGPVWSFQRITDEDIAGLTRELSVMVDARVPLARGLLSIAEQETKPQLSEMIQDIAAQVESGATMSDALTRYQSVFGEVYIETMRAAEKSGNLVAVTGELADLLDRQMDLRKQLRQAMTYPVVVLATVCAAFGVFIGFVIPRFAGQFKNSGVELPLATRIVQGFGESVRHEWWAYLLAIVSAIFAVVTSVRTPGGRVAFERMLMCIPAIGPLTVSAVTARFLRVMSITVGSGLDLVEAVIISGRATGQHAFSHDCSKVADRLSKGETLAEALASVRSLPVFARRMLGAGHDSADLSRAALLVAKHFDRKASMLTKSVSSLIEPIMTVLMAGLVLLVALSVFLPMWQLARIGK